MDVVIAPTGVDVGRIAADLITATVQGSADAVLGIATGSSPLETYRELARRVADGVVDLSAVRAFALDEYVGLGSDHPESYRSVIRREVIGPLRLTADLVQTPDGDAPDLDAACARYERMIRDAGGVDIQLLGIGANGHIGFNEPLSSFSSRTRVATLTAQTRRDNARFFESLDDVPHQCVTQGIGTIMDARCLVLVADGERKAESVARMIEGPVTDTCPASALQLHPHAVVIVDESAARILTPSQRYDRRTPVSGVAR